MAELSELAKMLKLKWDGLDDPGRWMMIATLPADTYKVLLDNDATYVVLYGDQDGTWLQFDHYLGWSEGVFILLGVMGVPVEGV